MNQAAMNPAMWRAREVHEFLCDRPFSKRYQSASDIARHFGWPKRQVNEALNYARERGLVKRHFDFEVNEYLHEAVV